MVITTRFAGMLPGVCCVAAVVFSTSQADAQTEQPKPTGSAEATAITTAPAPAETGAKAKPFDLRTTENLTGDWGGVRTKLADAGIKMNLKFMNQIMVNMHGGLETKNGHDTGGSYDLDFYFDLEKMNLIKGAEIWFRGKGTWGGDDGDFDKEKVGGLFKTNADVSAEEPIFVDKWHWKQKLADGKLELRLGRQEPTKDLFDTSKVIGNEDKYFLNSALLRNATVPPTKGLSFYANWDFTEHAYVRAAIFDAQAQERRVNLDTAFHDEAWYRTYGELGCKPKLNSANGKLWGHYRIGTWFDSSEKKRFFDTMGGLRAERFDSNDWGFYTGFDQMVWKENDDAKDNQGIVLAARYGYAPGEVNKIEHFWSLAAHYEGLIPTRDKDLLGLGVAQGVLADEYRRVHAGADRETVYETYYAIQVTPWLSITPDLQFITNTGGDEDDPDTFVAGLRFGMIL